MKFTKVLLVVAAISGGVHLLRLIGVHVPGLLVVANLFCLILLTTSARGHHLGRSEGFDVIVAAETIVAFGIMSLILGLTVSIGPFLLKSDTSALNGATLAEAAIPFLEGLATAGAAPLFAMYLRNRAVEADAIANPTGDATDLAKAMALLTKDLREARVALDEFKKASVLAVTATRDLAEGLQTENERLKFVVAESQANIRALGAAAQSSSNDVSQLADASSRLTTSAVSASTMLEALAKLIESVERFVAPSTPGRARKR